MQRIAFKVLCIQTKRHTSCQRECAAGGVLEHLVSQATYHVRNDHNNPSTNKSRLKLAMVSEVPNSQRLKAERGCP
jgi:hypothetical protein